MVQDNVVDGQGIRILVIKKPESKFPAVFLSDIPAKESENDKLGRIKFVIKPRPKASTFDLDGLDHKRSPVRTVEERKEECDQASARIFSSPSKSGSEDVLTWSAFEGTSFPINDTEVSRDSCINWEKINCSREGGNSSRVVILRDREKDRIDPDYHRSYDKRYVKNVPCTQRFRMAPFNMQNSHLPFVQHDAVFPQLGQVPATQASLNYQNLLMSPYRAMGLSQDSGDALGMQWPMQSMMYAQSYHQLRHGFFQGPLLPAASKF